MRLYEVSMIERKSLELTKGSWQDTAILCAVAVGILVAPAAWGGLIPDLPNYPLYLLFAVIVLGKFFYLTHYLTFLVTAGLQERLACEAGVCCA